jgi:hypothetical protein
VEVYGTIFTVAESPLEKGLIWVGSDDGLVYITRDGGGHWDSVTVNIPGLPEWGTISMIEASHHHPGTAYLTVDAHRLDNMEPYLYGTHDFGKTWVRLDGPLQREVYLHAVREDPVLEGMLYVGTERGVVFSKDGGVNWSSLRLNLPTVAVHDLQVKENSLVLGTHGRSVWIFDDLYVLRSFGPDTHLSTPPVSIQWVYHSDRKGGFAKAGWAGKNPPQGVSIYYRLDEEPEEEITLEVFDGEGTLVRRLSSIQLPLTGYNEYPEREKETLKAWVLPTKVGINRAVWDLRWNGAEMIQGGILDFGYPRIGPLALPGNYTVELKVDEAKYTAELLLKLDPRRQFEEVTLRRQLAFALRVRDTITAVTRSVNRLRVVRKQLNEHREMFESEEKSIPLRKLSEGLIVELGRLEGQLHNSEAKIAYDILAMKGGAKLYARLSKGSGGSVAKRPSRV